MYTKLLYLQELKSHFATLQELAASKETKWKDREIQLAKEKEVHMEVKLSHLTPYYDISRHLFLYSLHFLLNIYTPQSPLSGFKTAISPT